MGSVLAEVAPLALGIAASPFPVVPAILLLFTSRPRPTAGAFLTGWFTGILMVTTLAVALASLVEMAEETPTWAAWTKLVLGAVLVLLGVKQWLGRAGQTEPGWIAALETATPRSAARLGVLLSAANPKVVLLAAGGGLAIGASELTVPEMVPTVMTFTAISSVSVALPLLLFTVAGDRVLGPLSRGREWLRAHNAAVVAVVLVAIGSLLVVDAVSTL